MKQPVFVYYELNNYYQNHRLYAKSLSTKQLAGDILTSLDVISVLIRLMTIVLRLYLTQIYL